ncbi:MAG: Coenzyme F420 hydrogenase/dehydrogenase, beta subunit C-terminal domain [Candidatus Bathyarchaeia archaeon]
MGSKKLSFTESLARDIIEAGKCVGCGTCVVVCPFNCLEYAEEKPSLAKECKICGICAQTCPRYGWSSSKAENYVFGRERRAEEDFGIYRRLTVAKARDKNILKVCQDGGMVTALLTFGLENGLIDAAIVSDVNEEKPLHPIPKLATTSEDILKCAGTKYCYSPNILALADALKQKKMKIAFVGTPCQIRAVRQMQMAGLKKYTAPIVLLIGLMCSECFTYEGLLGKHLMETMGINLKNIRKLNIKGKLLVTMDSGVQAIPLAEIKQYARKSCGFCADFSSEFADISAGGLGLDGWTFTVIRTEKGEEIFSKAEKSGIIETRNVYAEENALNLLRKLSKKKRKI